MRRIYQQPFLLLLFSLLFSLPLSAKPVDQRAIVGQLETIEVQDADLDYLARIDTGAARTSIHAIDIEVLGSDLDDNMHDHIGMPVRFTTVNAEGEQVTLEKTIVKVSKIRNAQGVERRYGVALTLVWNGQPKELIVNLRDRSKMKYKLLIGRDWLHNDYLVDVDKLDEDDAAID